MSPMAESPMPTVMPAFVSGVKTQVCVKSLALGVVGIAGAVAIDPSGLAATGAACVSVIVAVKIEFKFVQGADTVGGCGVLKLLLVVVTNCTVVVAGDVGTIVVVSAQW